MAGDEGQVGSRRTRAMLDDARRLPRAPLTAFWLADRPWTPEWPRRVVDLRPHPPYRRGMDRRRFLLTSLAGALAAPLAAEAQPSRRGAQIAFLSSSSSSTSVHEGFRLGLRELGWIEGQNNIVEYRFADGHERLPAVAAELVRAKFDIIVALATPATAAAKNATATIPIVMIGAGDPVSSGFVASLARPGGNVTGLAFSGGGMGILAKQLELLMEAVPKITRVAILSNPTNPNHPRWTKELMDAGRFLRVPGSSFKGCQPRRI